MKTTSLLYRCTYTLAIIWLLQSCAATSSIKVDVIRPADIDMPREIQSLGVIDRSHPGKDGKVLNVLEGLFSGEGLYQDKYSSERAINGLVNALNLAPKFKATYIIQQELTGTGMSYFAEALNWDVIEDLCEKNNVDAIVALEIFDSDKRTTFQDYTRQVRVNGKYEDRIYQKARRKTTVTVGWRVYDPSTKRIFDEFKTSNTETNEAYAETQDIASQNLRSYRDVVGEVAETMGKEYSIRISPTKLYVYRFYYTKGSPLMKDATASVKVGKWDEAMNKWQSVLKDHPKPKIQSRAAYNIALAYEIDGQLDNAIEYAEKSYKLGNKRGLKYVNLLNQRKADRERAKDQLEGE